MITFWRYRFAKPSAACRAWIVLWLNSRVNDISERAAAAVIGGKTSKPEDVDCISFMWDPDFRNQNIGNVKPLEDFDERQASVQHGNWPKWALDAL